MTNTKIDFEIGIEKESQGETDKKKAKYKDKSKGSAKGKATVDSLGNVTIVEARGTNLDLTFELEKDNWDNYHFENSNKKMSFSASVANATWQDEFTISEPATGQTSRTMTVLDLNNDGKDWNYQITLFLNDGLTPSAGTPATLTLDPVIKNKV